MADSAEAAIPGEVLAAFECAGAKVSAFERGLINRHWLVEQGDSRLVLRRYTAARSRAAVEWEQALVEHAAKCGWPVAAPFPTPRGETVIEHTGRLWSAAPFLPGEPDLEPTLQSWRRRGELLARLHLDLAAFEAAAQRPGFSSDTDLDGLLGRSGAGTFAAAMVLLAREEPDLARIAMARRAESVRELEALGLADVPTRAIHGDFQDFNLLWTDGEMTGLLDFDFCRLDAQVHDLAVTLVPFMPLTTEEAGAVIEGYASVRELSIQERLLLPVLARTHLLWWSTHLITGWLSGDRAASIPGIRRTLTIRLPALDAAEADWRAAGIV